MFVEDAAAVQQLGFDDGQGGVDVIGDVQPRPGAEGGGEVIVGADQGGQGGGVDDDFAALVGVVRPAGGQRRDQRGAGGAVSAVALQPDAAGWQRREFGDRGGLLGLVGVQGEFGVVGEGAAQLGHRRGQLGGRVVIVGLVVLDSADGEPAAALQPHQRGPF